MSDPSRLAATTSVVPGFDPPVSGGTRRRTRTPSPYPQGRTRLATALHTCPSPGDVSLWWYIYPGTADLESRRRCAVSSPAKAAGDL